MKWLLIIIIFSMILFSCVDSLTEPIYDNIQSDSTLVKK